MMEGDSVTATETVKEAVRESAWKIDRNVVFSALLKIGAAAFLTVCGYFYTTSGAWLKTQIREETGSLSAQISDIAQQIRPIQDTLKAAAEKDKINDASMADQKQRLALMEQAMARGYQDRQIFQQQMLDAVKDIRADQIAQGKLLAGLIAVQQDKGR